MITKLLTGLRFLGLKVTLQSIIYARHRDRWRRPPPPKHVPATSPGARIRQRQLDQGVELTFQNAVLTAQLLCDDLARLTWSPGRQSPEYACAAQDWPAVTVSIEAAGDRVRLTTPRLQIELSQSGDVEFLDSGGRVLSAYDPPSLVGEGWRLRSHLRHEERIFGLGERAAGFNLRPGRYRLWNHDPAGGYVRGHDPLYMAIPVMAGLHAEGSFLVFFDNPHDGWVSLDDQAQVEFEAGRLVMYFMPGPLDRALARYLELTGRPPLPPRWALGLHQSRWGYRTQNDVLDVLAGYQAHRLPLAAIHLDIDHLDDYKSFTVDEERFPDLPGLASKLHLAGTRLVVMVEPGVKQARGYQVFEEGVAGGHFCSLPNGRLMRGLVWPGWVGFPDFTRPETRQWWGSHYASLLDRGVDGVWHDMNEPTCFAAWGDTTFPDRTQHHLEGLTGDHRSAHNFYGLEMNRAGFEALRSTKPDKRPFLLTRSGWAGVQRFAWHWTGDTVSSWEDLQLTVPSLLGLSLSGIPFSGPDIGGFNGHPDAELYLRWFELSTLLPFLRIHSAATAPPREPWRFGSEVTHHVRELLLLRQRLMPYLYTMAAEAAQKGAPMIRPVFWFDSSDADLWPVEDSFAVGPALLAAPVLWLGERSRPVRLPAGVWFDYWTGDRYEGSKSVALQAPLGRPTILLRAGAILPEVQDGRLSLSLALPDEGEASGSVYSDAGDGYGPSRWDDFTARVDGQTCQLSRSGHGEFPFEHPAVALCVPRGRGRITDLRVDGAPASPEALPPEFRRAEFVLQPTA